METVSDSIFLGSKITADGDCSTFQCPHYTCWCEMSSRMGEDREASFLDLESPGEMVCLLLVKEQQQYCEPSRDFPATCPPEAYSRLP